MRTVERAFPLISSFALLLGLALPARAQYVVNEGAATAGESWARGAADVIRSQGQYNLQNSEAAINWTQARSQQINNDLQQTQVFFDKRNMNYQNRFAGQRQDRAAINAQKQMIRYGQEGRPKRLTSKEIDPLTGRITWPILLQGPEYKEPRDTLTAMMQTRAQQEGAIGLEGYETIMGATQQMYATLQSKIQQLNSQDFVDTKNFIDRLVYTVKNPAQ
jgi:hypothetical protein